MIKLNKLENFYDLKFADQCKFISYIEMRDLAAVCKKEKIFLKKVKSLLSISGKINLFFGILFSRKNYNEALEKILSIIVE